jgi:hypothetical protein
MKDERKKELGLQEEGRTITKGSKGGHLLLTVRTGDQTTGILQFESDPDLFLSWDRHTLVVSYGTSVSLSTSPYCDCIAGFRHTQTSEQAPFGATTVRVK